MLLTLLTTLVPALLPALSDGMRGVIARFTGSAGAKPQNVTEVISLMQADTQRLQAIASLDTPSGPISVWVANIRALQRPIAVALVLGGYLYSLHYANTLPQTTLDTVSQYAQMVTFYLFGDRSYMYLKGK
jgi:hypothetical protein